MIIPILNNNNNNKKKNNQNDVDIRRMLDDVAIIIRLHPNDEQNLTNTKNENVFLKIFVAVHCYSGHDD